MSESWYVSSISHKISVIIISLCLCHIYTLCFPQMQRCLNTMRNALPFACSGDLASLNVFFKTLLEPGLLTPRIKRLFRDSLPLHFTSVESAGPLAIVPHLTCPTTLPPSSCPSHYKH